MRGVVALTLALAAGAACLKDPAPRAPAQPAPAPTKPAAVPSPADAPTPASSAPAPHVVVAPDFARDVQPILARACDPCHFPGGKMYERMPFDDPSTLASHKEGVLRRLKGDDRATFERWLAGLSGEPGGH